MVDVVNKRCQHVGCKKRPVFGFEGEKGRFCSLHRSGVRNRLKFYDRECRMNIQDEPGMQRVHHTSINFMADGIVFASYLFHVLTPYLYI